MELIASILAVTLVCIAAYVVIIIELEDNG